MLASAWMCIADNDPEIVLALLVDLLEKGSSGSLDGDSTTETPDSSMAKAE